jgi:hypothetical protein
MRRFSKYNIKWFIFNDTIVYGYNKHLFGLENIYKHITL